MRPLVCYWVMRGTIDEEFTQDRHNSGYSRIRAKSPAELAIEDGEMRRGGVAWLIGRYDLVEVGLD